ncbi:MAG: hypothetical protein IJV41_01025 [Oscillospiraceae bacterium]|nr:hypothetical protein [Oscillospiraceae bacterium]
MGKVLLWISGAVILLIDYCCCRVASMSDRQLEAYALNSCEDARNSKAEKNPEEPTS